MDREAWCAAVGDGQGGLVCCSPQGHKELDMTERLNFHDLEVKRKEERSYDVQIKY